MAQDWLAGFILQCWLGKREEFPFPLHFSTFSLWWSPTGDFQVPLKVWNVSAPETFSKTCNPPRHCQKSLLSVCFFSASDGGRLLISSKQVLWSERCLPPPPRMNVCQQGGSLAFCCEDGRNLPVATQHWQGRWNRERKKRVCKAFALSGGN